MRDALVRHQHVVDDVGQALQIAQHDLQQIIGVAGERIGLLDIVDRLTRSRKCLALSGEWVASVMCMKAITLKPSARRRDRRDSPRSRSSSSSRIRRREHCDADRPTTIGQLLVGQPAVVLQRHQYFQVEGID